MTSFTNWEANWVSLGLAGTSVLRGLPTLPGCFSGFSYHRTLWGGSHRHTNTYEHPLCTKHSTKAEGAWEEVEHLVWSQENCKLIKNTNQEVNMI